MIYIDGSHGEGGGQIIRTALALSALTGQQFKITNIRKGRQSPGLKHQHLTAVTAVSDICNAEVMGAEVGSTELTFIPGTILPGKYRWDIGTAGSITLVLQALLPVALHSQKEFEFSINGGTNVSWSPPVEHFQHVFCDYLKRMGAKVDFSILKYGFYPKGGGLVKTQISPSQLKSLYITERGELEKIDVWSIASQDLKKARVAERQVDGFKKILSEDLGKIHELYVSSDSIGSCIHAHAHFENCKLGVESLGEKNNPAESIGKSCAEKLKKELNTESTVDENMLDQILPYLAIYGGSVKFAALTEHAKTNMWIIEKFLPVKFDTEANTMSCHKK